MGYLTRTTTKEITISYATGWHAHAHIHLLFDRALSATEKALLQDVTARQWATITAKHTQFKASQKHGTHTTHATDREIATLANYQAKWGYSPTLAPSSEIIVGTPSPCNAPTFEAESSLHPNELLDIISDHAQTPHIKEWAKARYQEYAHATHQKQHISTARRFYECLAQERPKAEAKQKTEHTHDIGGIELDLWQSLTAEQLDAITTTATRSIIQDTDELARLLINITSHHISHSLHVGTPLADTTLAYANSLGDTLNVSPRQQLYDSLQLQAQVTAINEYSEYFGHVAHRNTPKNEKKKTLESLKAYHAYQARIHYDQAISYADSTPTARQATPKGCYRHHWQPPPRQSHEPIHPLATQPTPPTPKAQKLLSENPKWQVIAQNCDYVTYDRGQYQCHSTDNAMLIATLPHDEYRQLLAVVGSYEPWLAHHNPYLLDQCHKHHITPYERLDNHPPINSTLSDLMPFE